MNPPTAVDIAGMPPLRRALAAVTTTVVLAVLPATGAGAAGDPFVDDDHNSHEPDIEAIHAAGITNGCAPDRFCPDDPVTRGQMAAFLNRALTLPPANAPSGFTDTTGTFHDDIERLFAAGITNGCAPDRFCPDDPVTRGQMAAFLNRALTLPAATIPSGFTDTTGTFHDDIERLAAAGITNGCGGTRYCTDQPVTRAQMATFLVRALDDVGAPSSPSSPSDSGRGEGDVAVTAVADADFDVFTSGGHWSFIHDHYDSLRVYRPYWDSRIDEYDDVFAYRVVYGISAREPLPAAQTDWVLRDASGDPVYIDFDCGSGCVRYAADVTDPQYRADFLAWVRDTEARGYRGIMLDDVNFAWRFSNRWGDEITPLDPVTGQPLTLANWQRYLADFLVEIERAAPGLEIMHNVIWYADSPGFGNAQIDRAIAAADYIQLERGANDRGLVRGDGTFGMQRFLAFVDRVHDLGAGVLLLDQHAEDEAGQEYNLAAALLVNEGDDMVSTSQDHYIDPHHYWSGFDTDLGHALGGRYTADGVTRRDFTGGVVVFNDPGAPTRTIGLDAPMRRIDGTVVTSVTLGPREAAVLSAT
jgi:hypothetical protein